MPDKYRMTPEDRDLMIRTIIGEAADQPENGQAAVAHVIMNRLRSGRHGNSPSDVVLARGQFEPWQTRARELMSISPKSRQYQRVSDVVDGVTNGERDDPTNGERDDPTNGATHFLDEAVVRRRRGGSLPSWATGDGQRIGDHTFYAPEGRVGALGYAPEDLGTSIAGTPDERTAATGAGRPVRLAQASPASPEDIEETLRQAGLSRGAGVASQPAPRTSGPSDNDIAETLRQAGVTMGQTAKPILKPAPLPEPPPGKLGPAGQAMAEQRASEMGPASALVEGVPVAGPLLGRTLPAATGAAFPSTGSMPGDTFMQRFTGNKEVMDEASRLYAERHPNMSLTGGILGSTALTGLGMMSWPTRLAMGMEGPSLASKIYTGMMGESGINALDAALRGENVPNAAMVGAGGGAAGPLIGAGAQAIGRGVARNLPVYSGPLAATNAVARNKLFDVLSEGGIDEGRRRMGPAGFFGDINQAATDIAGGIADTPGPGKALVRGAYMARDAGQPSRIDRAITDATGLPHVNIEDFKKWTTEARAAAADPLYEQWRSMKVEPTDKLLNEIMPRLEKAGAFNMAEELAGISGHNMNRASFSKAGAPTNYPTTETWDYVKRGLDRRIDQAYSANDKTLARSLIDLKHDFLKEIENTPAGSVWKQARQEFASRSAILDQIEAGRDTFLGGRSGLSVDELKHELRGLSGPERAARLQGLRAAADQVMGDTLRGDTTLRNKILAPNNQAKMRMLLGDDRANRLIETMQQEKFLKDQTSSIVHGTQTTPKKERVDALKAPDLPHWSPNLAAPFTWVPPSATPSGVMAGWRGQRYADSVNQLAGLVTTPNDARLNTLLDALSKEGRRRSRIENIGNIAGNSLSALVTGPGTSTARRFIFPTQ